MRVPSITEAETLIEEASKLNPGPWIEHNRTADSVQEKLQKNVRI